MAGYKNQHGRRPGRGIRPWILIPKVIAIAALFGGFLASAVILHNTDPQSLEQWGQLIQTISTVFRLLIVPAALAVIVLGALLLLQHPRVFLKMRWVRLKLALLVMTLPALHLWARSLFGQAREALQMDQLDRVAALMGRFSFVVDLAVAAVVVVIVLARLKPRLGEKPGARAGFDDAGQKPTGPQPSGS